VFEPLLLEEAGAQVLRGIEEGVVIEPHESVVAACSKVGTAADLCRARGYSGSLSWFGSQACCVVCQGACASTPAVAWQPLVMGTQARRWQL
jgi:hypothetical protein